MVPGRKSVGLQQITMHHYAVGICFLCLALEIMFCFKQHGKPKFTLCLQIREQYMKDKALGTRQETYAAIK